MNVLLTNMHGQLGGGEFSLLAHSRSLIAQGHQVYVYLQSDGPIVARLQAEGAETFVLPFAWRGSKLRSLLEVSRHVRKIIGLVIRRRIDLVMAYTLNDLVFAGIAARVTLKPLIYRSQGDVLGGWPAPPKSWLGSYLLPVLRVLKTHVVTTTAYELESYKRLGYPEKRLSWIPLGVDQQKFNGSVFEASVASLRDELYRGRLIIGIFGRLVAWKGQKRVILALAELKQAGLPCDLLIVGDHVFGGGLSYKNELETLAAEKGVSTQVRVLGHRDDVHTLMAACDVVVHASDMEPFGLVLVEAMSAGRPVVAMDLPGPRESVLPEKTGILVPVRDVSALASAVRRLMEDPSLRMNMGRCGRERAAREFDEAKNLGRLNEAMVSLVADGGNKAKVW